MNTTPLYIHVDGVLAPASEAKVSVFDAGFQSGDAVWEGLRVYNGTALRLQDHLTRLEHSARALRINLPGSRADIARALQETLDANDFRHDVHVRLMVTRGARSTSGMDPRNAPPRGCLVIIAERKPVEESPAPQRLRTASIRRPRPQVLDPGIHHANQLNSILARLETWDDPDVDASLMLDPDGFVAEADTANIFCVTGNRVRTPFATSCLHGITRATVLEEAAARGYQACEERLSLFELYCADEVFLTGTVCELVPVTGIDGRRIGTGDPGPVWRELLDSYRARVARETSR